MNHSISIKQSNQAKGVAILLLLFYHAFEHEEMIMKLAVNHDPIPKDIFLLLSSFGNICVSMFIAITVYGIVQTIDFNMGLKRAMDQAGKRFVKLCLGFFTLYLSIIIIFFSYFDLSLVYGSGFQSIPFFLADAFGLSALLDLPMLNPTWWYMEIAILLIALVPLVVFAYEKLGKGILLLALVVPSVFTLGTDLEPYIFVLAVSIWVAREKVIEKMIEYQKWKSLRLFVFPFLIIAVILVRQNFMIQSHFLPYVDAVVAWLLVYICIEISARIKILGTMLSFIGKYSMNIFLMHTFIYMLLFQPTLYQLHYAILIYLVLLVICLLYSIVLEFVKAKLIWLSTCYSPKRQ